MAAEWGRDDWGGTGVAALISWRWEGWGHTSPGWEGNLFRCPSSPGAARTQVLCKAEAISDCPQIKQHVPFTPLNEKCQHRPSQEDSGPQPPSSRTCSLGKVSQAEGRTPCWTYPCAQQFLLPALAEPRWVRRALHHASKASQLCPCPAAAGHLTDLLVNVLKSYPTCFYFTLFCLTGQSLYDVRESKLLHPVNCCSCENVKDF